ncbi:hypothetical protein GA0074696_5529 [Micromonospora purpureochromogenes]|uniref:DivIVA domain-containing protein n=1 Tax=Micromonospora purpureochromogenes TaxID=47872 RepID=A0A1C5A8I8_9ACTN|nr:hypothetical protein [Micromonospora purpureochromogenes]SCF41391.1 hypothetical protein GA0074696_5529 [Micromonospora purpureochromogenes]
MTVHRSRQALRGPFTPDRITTVPLPLTRRGRRGYRDVDALLHRLAFELGKRSRQLEDVRAENQRIKRALRTWQSDHVACAIRSEE